MESADPDPWRHLAGLQQVAHQILPHAFTSAQLLTPMLGHLSQAGACVGGVVWRGERGAPRIWTHQFREPLLNQHDWIPTLTPWTTAHFTTPQVVPLQVGSTPGWLVMVPLATGDQPPPCLGLVFQQPPPQSRPGPTPGEPTPTLAPAPSASHIDFACAVADLVTLSLVRQQRDQLARQPVARDRLDAQIDTLYAAASGSGSPSDFLATVQATLGADRAWLFDLTRSPPRLQASSLPRVDAHPDRQLAVLTQLVGLVAGRRVAWQGEAGQLPPPDDPATPLLLEYLDLSRNRRVELLPLGPSSDLPRALLVLDHCTGHPRAGGPDSPGDAPDRVPGGQAARPASASLTTLGTGEGPDRERLLRHVARGWSLVEERGLGGWWLRLLRWWQGSDETLRGRWLVAAAAGLLLCLFCPWRLEITAEADLEPAEQRRIFAPEDGVVQRILARDGDDVVAGQLLLELDSTSLQARRTELETGLQTQRARLQALQSARGRRTGSREEPPGSSAGELEETRRTIAGLETQLTLLGAELESLAIRSPMDGRVDQFDMEQRLLRRPVSRGQELLRVEQQAGPWQLRVRIPAAESSYVAAALQTHGSLPVRYQFVTSPGTTWRGTLTKLADRLETDRQGRLWLRGEVTVQPAAREGQRAGGGAVVRIDCGWRTLGFVLFREVRDRVASWWW